MKKIIYSKYSNERAPRFQIRTDILEDENGMRTAQKIALTQEAQKHIAHVFDCYNKLRDSYQNSRFEICKTNLIDESTLEFEYLYGTPMEKALDELLYSEKLDEFTVILDHYVEEMKKLCVNHFEKSDGFTEIFGDLEPNAEELSLPIANIDQIFQNIIIDQERWLIYDYEWTLDFMVPLKYVLYRCALYYGEFDRKLFLSTRMNLFQHFHISEKEKLFYEQMEERMQAYILKGFTPLSEVYRLMKPRVFSTVELALKEEINRSGYNVVVRKTKTGNQVESHSLDLLPDKGGKVTFDISLSSDIQTLQIVPAHYACVVVIHDMKASGCCEKELDYLTNGICLGEHIFCFPDDNAGVWLEGFDGFDTLHVEMSVSIVEGAIMAAICNCALEAEDAKKNLVAANQGLAAANNQVLKLQAEQERMRAQIQRLSQDYNSVTGSFCWRMTKPIRKILDFVKKR